MRWWLRFLLSGLPAPPPVSRLLLITLGLLGLVGLNWQFRNEIWPNTPGVRSGVLPLGMGILWWLVLPPQVVAWGWRWLRACTGPSWLRLLLLMVLLGLRALAAGCWLVLPLLLW